MRFSLLLSALAILAAAAPAQNLVQDPGFESAALGYYTTGQTIDGGSWFVGDFYVYRAPVRVEATAANNGHFVYLNYGNFSIKSPQLLAKRTPFRSMSADWDISHRASSASVSASAATAWA